MLFLQLPLLLVLLPGGANEDGFQESISFQLLVISSFYNHSCTQNLGLSWLGEFQTHVWNSRVSAFIYLRPWSKGNFSNEELMELEKLLHLYFIRTAHIFHNHVIQGKLEYPCETQAAGGCGLHHGEARVACRGSELLSFQNSSWLPSPKGATRAQLISVLFNLNHLGNIHRTLSDTCSRFLLGLLDAGKADLQRQVRPEAWLSPGPSLGPGRLMLVCHVSGFHPKPIWAMWMWGEREQRGTQRSDILPNADGTWYLRISLGVETSEASGLSCRVKHSSLRGRDIILYWGQHSSMGCIFWAVTVPLVLVAGLAFWLRKR
uniref:Ig-like domain-containing protein n=1 Tax=Catagonus wagneri TaxID=51154 RepID=A0A8C3WWP0_9CETA